MILLLLLFGAAVSCRTTRPPETSPPTRVDRLVASYADLRGGRFAVVADFEDPRHSELFRLVSASEAARYTIDPRRGRPQTGRRCLLFTSGGGDDTIVISNADAENWYLKRDWRAFDLLMMSAWAPRAGLSLEVTVAGRGSEAAPDRTAGATIPLDAGWNLVRMDLAAIAERVPLDDVREIRLSVAGSSEPVDVAFDDFLLTAARRVLLGDPSNRDSGLYVEQVGRRWRIGAAPAVSDGAGSDFELTFANGQIVEWYNLAVDPHRLSNLVRGARLGPMPMVVGSADANERDFLPLGSAVVVHSQITELNSVRVVITCEWRFVNRPHEIDTGLDARPSHRWVYTIYPSGQIYVQVEATVATATWSAPEVGLGVTIASSGPGIETKVVEPPPDLAPQEGLAYATARNEERDAVLLYVVQGANRFIRMSSTGAIETGTGQGAEQVGHESLVAVGGRRQGDVHRWKCHVFVGSSSTLSEEEAQSRALAYLQPSLPRINTSTAGGSDRPGRAVSYEPAQGCFVITADSAVTRLVLSGGGHPYFSPCFELIGSAGREAWVYADHSLVTAVARDAGGELLFQLPGRKSSTTLLEVLFGKALDGPTGAD